MEENKLAKIWFKLEITWSKNKKRVQIQQDILVDMFSILDTLHTKKILRFNIQPWSRQYVIDQLWKWLVHRSWSRKRNFKKQIHVQKSAMYCRFCYNVHQNSPKSAAGSSRRPLDIYVRSKPGTSPNTEPVCLSFSYSKGKISELEVEVENFPSPPVAGWIIGCQWHIFFLSGEAGALQCPDLHVMPLARMKERITGTEQLHIQQKMHSLQWWQGRVRRMRWHLAAAYKSLHLQNVGRDQMLNPFIFICVRVNSQCSRWFQTEL